MDQPTDTGAASADSAAGSQDLGTGADTSADAAASAAAADKGAQDDKAQAQPETTVPVNVLTAVRDENKGLKDQIALYQTQLQTMQNQPAPAAAPVPDAAADPLAGISDDDIVSAGQVRAALASAGSQVDPTVLANLTNVVSEIQLTQQDANWQQTVKTYLPKMMETDPTILTMIQSQPNQMAQAKLALAFAKSNPEYVAAKATAGGAQPAETAADQINRIIENANKPGSVSQAAGAGGATIHPGDKYKAMSDADFDAYVAKVKSGKT